MRNLKMNRKRMLLKLIKPKILNFLVLGITVLSVLFALSCTNSQYSEGEKIEVNKNKQITILFDSVPSDIILSHLAAVIIQEQDYNVQLQYTPKQNIFKNLAQQWANLYFGAQLPLTDHNSWQTYGDSLDILGKGYSEVLSGLMVPDYTYINSITQMNTHQKKFNQTIYLPKESNHELYFPDIIDQYSLHFKTQVISNASFLAVLDSACKNKEWIVFYKKHPDGIWNNYSLKFLADYQQVFKHEHYATIARTGFKDEFPYIAEFIEKYEIPENLMVDFINNVDPKNEITAFFKEWHNNNNDLIEAWFPEAWIDR